VTPTCPRCGRPTPDGYVCVSCGITKPSEQLRAIADLVPAARLVAAGLVRRGSGGNGSNKPGSRSPGNDDAIDALDEIQNALTTIVRDIAETRGLAIEPDGRSRPLSASVAAERAELVPAATPEPMEAS
jgi:hypothetical protein